MLWASWRKVPKSADRYAGAELRWSCSVIKAQCQTILLHTSFKLRFNGHIITFSPMKFKQFQPNPFARSIYPRSQITMWGFAWHFQGLGICHRNTARLTAAPREKTKTRTRSRITSEEKGVCVCVCVCAQRGLCFGGERTCCCLPVRCSVFRWGTDACVLPGAPLPAAGASRRQWPPPCSSRWSRRKAAPSHYSASPAHTQPETHTEWSLDVILHKHNHKRTAKWQIRYILILIIIKAAIWGSFLDWITIDQSSSSYLQKNPLIW